MTGHTPNYNIPYPEPVDQVYKIPNQMQSLALTVDEAMTTVAKMEGPKGDKGEPGSPGPRGPQGPKGPKGDPGETDGNTVTPLTCTVHNNDGTDKSSEYTINAYLVTNATYKTVVINVQANGEMTGANGYIYCPEFINIPIALHKTLLELDNAWSLYDGGLYIHNGKAYVFAQWDGIRLNQVPLNKLHRLCFSATYPVTG